MEVTKEQVFNLWDTNGRRHDVINALEIYLRLLRELHDTCPSEQWGSYPNSTLQYRFYKAAIDASPDVFQEHPKFDTFENFLGSNHQSFYNKTLAIPRDKRKKLLDEGIEKRARHYTSNLVKLGFADENRVLSYVGNDLLMGSVKRDQLEKMLPITDTNLIILRQLLKLKIFTTANPQGVRYSYSPCLMAFYILLAKGNVDTNYFKQQIQGILPYWKEQINLDEDIDNLQIFKANIDIPQPFQDSAKILQEVFCSYIHNQKSSTAVPLYYQFYSALFDYIHDPNEMNYVALRNILLGKNKHKFKKAFGKGDNIFLCGTKASPFTHEQFKEKNAGSPMLTENINLELYKNYVVSKYIDQVKEYSDTTSRMLSATGLFRFNPSIELMHKNVFQVIFSHFALRQSIFQEFTSEEYFAHESGLSADFFQSASLINILNFSPQDVRSVLTELKNIYGNDDVSEALLREKREKFESHIRDKYPKEEILNLLKLFTNRNNDNLIKQKVNEDASVPTIYEYVVGIAWYYISNEKISVYDSLRLTLNGDFEPVTFAKGGDGDIEVSYPDKTILLEVTLMNAAAQKRGEWEPVLRHAINLTARKNPLRVYTLFVADELDYNTINIWRAVAAVTLKSTQTGIKTEHVVIMPFKNEHICKFIEQGISDDQIISAIDKSFDEIKANFDDTWHSKIIESL